MPRPVRQTELQQLLDRLARVEAASTAPGLPELMTVQDLAKFLRTSPNAVRQMHGRGQLPAPVHVGGARRLLWRKPDVAQWLDRTESRPEGSRLR